ncbi:MAG: phosphoenolpyruvate--protein phosphotransferase [Bacillota bacterium]
MKGLGASQGIAIGRVYIKKTAETQKRHITDIERELVSLSNAADASRKQLEEAVRLTFEKLGEKEADIFKAHILLLEDPEFAGSIERKIRENSLCASWAVEETAKELAALFEGIEDEYIKERVSDIRDVSARLIQNLSGSGCSGLGSINEPCIIAAKDITPSDMTELPRDKVLGIVSELGGVTSHTAIMSRVMGIPAVVAADGFLNLVKAGDMLILDGYTGELHINPSENMIAEYRQILEDEERAMTELRQYTGRNTVSRDGAAISIGCNIGTPRDISSVIENDGEGIGLFRSEFLYMDRIAMPSEEEQYEAYKSVVENMRGRAVIIRTLDIGGDKQLPYLNIPKEENPFLGLRAIRYCLLEKDIFRTQLRAILRASAHGEVKLMLPMITGLDELLEARSELNELMTELDRSNIKYDRGIELGIMIETPAAALISDILAEEADFFSIGTNDLIQYTIAVDRMNSSIADLYTPYHPAVLRLIKLVTDNGHKAGKWVGMCGEAAQDEKLVPILLGMGLDELSVSPPKVLKLRRLISGISKEDMKVHADIILKLSNTEAVLRYIEEYVVS